MAPLTHKCMKLKCTNFDAVCVPVVRVWWSWAKDHNPLECEFTGLWVCNDCQHGLSLDDLLSVEGQEMIERPFRALGRGLPDWSTAELYFREPIRKGKP